MVIKTKEAHYRNLNQNDHTNNEYSSPLPAILSLGGRHLPRQLLVEQHRPELIPREHRFPHFVPQALAKDGILYLLDSGTLARTGTFTPTNASPDSGFHQPRRHDDLRRESRVGLRRGFR